MANIVIAFTVLDPINATDPQDNCLLNSSICLPPGNSVTGSQKLINSAIILNYYYSVKNINDNAILLFLTDLYDYCEFNYSIQCLKNILNKYNSVASQSLALLEQSIRYPMVLPFYYVSGIPFFIEKFIEQIYCLSSPNPPSECRFCNNNLCVDNPHTNQCSLSCNTSDCGFDNLKCLEADNCYSFMIGDGNCNNACINDPDCKNNQYNTTDSENVQAKSFFFVVYIVAGLIL